MMKHVSYRHQFKAILLSASLIFTAFSIQAFEEGKDYQVLETPIPHAEKSLIKVFSYDCPFCYKYDKSVTREVMKRVNGSVEFRPFHLSTKGKYGSQASQLFAVLVVKDNANHIDLLSDEALFKKAKFAYYHAYHDKKMRWDGGGGDFLKTGLEAVGMSREEFETALQTDEVQQLIKAWDDVAYEVAKIQGVPAFVVNGKYLILTKSIKSIDSFASLIKALSEQ